jgi:hypothetical protein
LREGIEIRARLKPVVTADVEVHLFVRTAGGEKSVSLKAVSKLQCCGTALHRVPRKDVSGIICNKGMRMISLCF